MKIVSLARILEKRRAASHLVAKSSGRRFPPMRLLEWPKSRLWAFTFVPKLQRPLAYMATLLGCFGAKATASRAKLGSPIIADPNYNRESVDFFDKIINN